MNKDLKQGSGVKSEISPADGKPKLSAVFVAETRYEARDKMASGEIFEAPSNISNYNRNLINAWVELYNYEKSKSRRGYDIYKPRE